MTARACARSTPAMAPLSAHLGVLGMPSFTAWYGMKHICKPKAGETVFVSAATGAVGQVAGQLAKLAGAKVVGCAGDEDKCRWAVREAGYDACFNHSTERDYGAVLDKLCPQGIDADFENVGGRIFHAVFERLNNFGRVAFCGAISEYQDADADGGPAQDVHDRAAAAHHSGLHRLRPRGPDGRVRERGRRAGEGRQAQEPRDGGRRSRPGARRPSWACSRARTSASWW